MTRGDEMEEIIQRAILVGVDLNNDKNFDYSVEELKNLAEACSVQVVGVLTQKLERVNPACYIGTGKVDEVALLVEQHDANLVIFNDEKNFPHRKFVTLSMDYNVKSSIVLF